MKMFWKNKKGFTLTELMVVVAILGILVAVAAPIFNSVTDTSKQAADEANVRTIQSAITMYSASAGVQAADIDNTSAHVTNTTTGVFSYLADKAYPESPYGLSNSYSITDGVATSSGSGNWK